MPPPEALLSGVLREQSVSLRIMHASGHVLLTGAGLGFGRAGGGGGGSAFGGCGGGALGSCGTGLP